MKLYELKQPGRSGPPLIIKYRGEILKFTHIDGLFSPCKTASGEVQYVYASESVELVSDDDTEDNRITLIP